MIRMLVQASRENKGRSAAEAASSRRASLDKFQAGHGGQPSLSLSRQVSESLSKRQREHASFSLTGRRSGRRADVQPWRGLAVTRGTRALSAHVRGDDRTTRRDESPIETTRR